MSKAFIAMVLDRSGSMDPLRDDVIGGFNTFLADQQALSGEAVFMAVRFDNEYEIMIEAMDIREVKPIDHSMFVPRGGTALLDAIGRTIYDVEARIAAMPEGDRPEKVIMVIFTDGKENSSSEFGLPRVTELITQRSAWQFLFLSSDLSSVHMAESMGMASSSHSGDSEGTRVSYRHASEQASASRTDKSMAAAAKSSDSES